MPTRTRSRPLSRTACSRSRGKSARPVRPSRGARSRSKADAGQRVFLKNHKEKTVIGGASSDLYRSISMARKQCQVCGQPATVRVEANLNGRHSTKLLCDDHYRQLVRQQKRTVSPLEGLFGSRSGLFEDFLGSDLFRIGDDAPSMAADTDEVVDASFGEPAPAGTGTARRRGSGLASRISEQSEAL